MASTFLVFNPGQEGGIARYAWYQAAEIRQWVRAVDVLCDRRPLSLPTEGVCPLDELVSDDDRFKRRSKPVRLAFLVGQLLLNQLILFRAILTRRPEVVLLSTYSEYLSPVWVWLQLAASKFLGITFVANLHDPVRDFAVGPQWWHKLSVKMAYWPLSAVFVHEQPPREAVIPRFVGVYQVPHGLFPLEPASRSRTDVRNEWGVPEEAIVLLAFGFIRDGKNLDLLIRALPSNPKAYLVVMGRVQSESVNKPISFYEKLATDLGVGERVKFFSGFVPDDKMADYFAAADAFAMAYSASFRSQSGVLNSAAVAGRPVLASSGPGPLKESVEKFGLGFFVTPDELPALSEGLDRICALVDSLRNEETLCSGSPRLDWEGYREYASWRRNAETVVHAVTKARREHPKA